MKISDLTNILTKASQLLGDADIKLQHVEGEVETELKGLSVLIETSQAAENGVATLLHGPAETSPAPDQA